MTLLGADQFHRAMEGVVAPAGPLGRAAKAGRSQVRPLERRDLEEVADVFLRVFRGIDDPARRRGAHPGLIAYLDQLYLGCPWLEPELGSLVYRDADGDLAGFLGSVQMHMMFEERRLTASAMGTYMVAHPRHDSRAALTLLRHHLASDLDIHFTDTANRTSLEFRKPLHFVLLAQHSLEWVYPLRPASLVLARAERRWPRLPLGLIGPVARRVDASIRRLLQGEERPRRDDAPRVVDMTREAFLAAAPTLVDDRRLKPDWRGEELGWLLDQASLRTGNGPLRIRAALDADGERAGFWLIWAEAGGIAAVLQVFARPDRQRRVIEAMIRDAEEIGCVAVRGTTEPRSMEALYAIPGLLFHHKGATNLRARDPEVMAAVAAGEVTIGGLTGESWTRLVSDRF